MQRHRRMPNEFRLFVESNSKSSLNQLRDAIQFEYKLILGREATESELIQAIEYFGKAQDC